MTPEWDGIDSSGEAPFLEKAELPVQRLVVDAQQAGRAAVDVRAVRVSAKAGGVKVSPALQTKDLPSMVDSPLPSMTWNTAAGERGTGARARPAGSSMAVKPITGRQLSPVSGLT